VKYEVCALISTCWDFRRSRSEEFAECGLSEIGDLVGREIYDILSILCLSTQEKQPCHRNH
jgi:hypothetical protein